MGSNISPCILNCFKLMHNLINFIYLGHNVSAYEYFSKNFKFSALLPWDCGLAKLPVVKKKLADPLVGPCRCHATPKGTIQSCVETFLLSLPSKLCAAHPKNSLWCNISTRYSRNLAGMFLHYSVFSLTYEHL